MKRQDYMDDLMKVYHQAPENKSMLYLQIEKGLNFKILILLLNREHLINVFKEFKTASFNQKIFLWLYYLQLLQLNEIVNNWNIEFLITHADMQPIENYITQVFNERNIDTITLQHGLYIDYSNLKNKNVVNYENIVSKYFLAWGNDTKHLISKYHRDVEVVVCGKVKRINDVLVSVGSVSYFTVVFDQQMFSEFNKKLLVIAKKLSRELKLKLNIRLHPANIKSDYSISESELINMNVTNSVFAIGHSSSMLFEIMTYDIPIYKLKSDIATNAIHPNLVFTNYKDLFMKVTDNAKFDFKAESEKYIDCHGELAEEKYKNFFQALKISK